MPEGDLTTRAERAFAFAQETAKQLITLSTGVFALTLTFLKDIAGPAPHGKTWLEVGWGFYLLSVLFGIFLLMTLAGSIERPQGAGGTSIYNTNIRLFAGLQATFFIAALACTLAFGVNAT